MQTNANVCVSLLCGCSADGSDSRDKPKLYRLQHSVTEVGSDTSEDGNIQVRKMHKWQLQRSSVEQWMVKKHLKTHTWFFRTAAVWAWDSASPLWPDAWGRASDRDPCQFGRWDVRGWTADLRHNGSAQRCDGPVRSHSCLQIRRPQLWPQHVQERPRAHDEGQTQIRVSHFFSQIELKSKYNLIRITLSVSRKIWTRTIVWSFIDQLWQRSTMNHLLYCVILDTVMGKLLWKL